MKKAIIKMKIFSRNKMEKHQLKKSRELKMNSKNKLKYLIINKKNIQIKDQVKQILQVAKTIMIQMMIFQLKRKINLILVIQNNLKKWRNKFKKRKKN